MNFLKRPTVVKNALLFSILSLFFLTVVKSLEGGVSALDLNNFILFFESKKALLGACFVVILTLFKGLKFSPFIFLSFCSFVLFQSFTFFIMDFDKLILLLIFLYSLTSYYFYLFLKLELQEPFYNPMYPQNIVSDFDNKNLPLLIRYKNEEVIAHLTNWGPNGFFCKLEDNEKNVKGRVGLQFDFDGTKFNGKGTVMAKVKGGVGIKIEATSTNDLGWQDYYDIISEYGLRPIYKS